MRPVIGVMPLFDTKLNSIWMLSGYLEGIEKNLGIPVVLPYTTDTKILEELDEQIDGYLFTGGNDIDPSLYNEVNKASYDINKVRDVMEEFIYNLAKKENKPVLGICRGIQIINALEGGSLYQDLELEHKSGVEHIMKAPYNRGVHKAIILRETPLYDILNCDTIDVNSYHHQAIKKLSPNLRILAMAPDDIIEGIYDKNRLFMVAIQWHPELFLENENSMKIFKAFVESSKKWHLEYKK